MISSNYPPSVGGPATSVPALSRKLTERGHEVTIVTRYLPGLPTAETNGEVEVYRPPSPVSGDFYRPRQALTHSISMGLLARRLIERGNFEIVHAHDINISGVAGLVASKSTRLHSIVKYSGDLVLECSSFMRWNQGKDITDLWNSRTPDVQFLKYLEMLIVGCHDIVVAPSQFQCKMLQSLGIARDRIRAIANAIDLGQIERALALAKLRDKQPKKHEIILMAGRLVPWKGVDFLISAMKLVTKSRPSARLMIVGDGPDLDRLERIAKSQGLLNRVVFFVGRKAYEEIPEYMARSDVFVLPSTYEPAPHVIIEAMSCSKPIVATKVGGIPELITDGVSGLLVEPKNTQSLADAILRLLEQKGLSQQLSMNAERKAREFDWNKIVEHYEKLYAEM